MGEVLGEAHAAARVPQRPQHRRQNPRRHLHGRGVHVRHLLPRRLDAQDTARPPRLKPVPHDQGSHEIHPLRDFVGQNALPGMQLIVSAAKFVQGDDPVVARHVGIVDRRPIEHPSVLAHRQRVRKPEGFPVRDDHAHDFLVRYPGADPRIQAHLGQNDLIGRPRLRHRAEGRQAFLVRAPAQFTG